MKLSLVLSIMISSEQIHSDLDTVKSFFVFFLKTVYIKTGLPADYLHKMMNNTNHMNKRTVK